jgi:hypothetical protein
MDTTTVSKMKSVFVHLTAGEDMACLKAKFPVAYIVGIFTSKKYSEL